MLKRIILFLMLATAACAFAETDGLPSPRNKTYHGYYYFRTEQGDSALMLVINNITVFPPERFKNKNQEQFYWRTVRDVRKGLPYAKLISATVIETYEYIETLPTTKEREAYLKSMERDVFNQYKPELKRFSRQQARVLVKLINRETNQKSYGIIKAHVPCVVLSGVRTALQCQSESRLASGHRRDRRDDRPHSHAYRAGTAVRKRRRRFAYYDCLGYF